MFAQVVCARLPFAMFWVILICLDVVKNFACVNVIALLLAVCLDMCGCVACLCALCLCLGVGVVGDSIG